MNNLKRLWSSRTIRLALLQAIVGIAIAFATEYEAVGIVAIIKSVADILIRIDTKTEL